MQLFQTPENRAPHDTKAIELITQDRVRLRAALATPKAPKGTVLILGGRAEFIERYFETMSDIAKMGYAVATFDWRGQGQSDRLIPETTRGYVRSFADYDLDIDAVYSRLLVAHCPRPYYALGHSTGGHMLIRALRGKKWLDKAVMSAPLMGFIYGAWPPPVARAMTAMGTRFGLKTAYVPGVRKLPFRMNEFDGNPLTSDRKRWNRDMYTLEKYPELAIGGPTYGWVNAAFKSFAEINQWPAAKGPSCPSLIVMAGRERVVNNNATKAFLASAPGFSSLTLADSNHEILNEKNEIRARFLAAFQAFITG